MQPKYIINLSISINYKFYYFFAFKKANGQMQQRLLARCVFQHTVGVNRYAYVSQYLYLLDLTKRLWIAQHITVPSDTRTL